MKNLKIVVLLLALLVLSCSTSSNLKSITTGDINLFLQQTPKSEDHPTAGADLLYSYAYIEYFEDGTSVTRNLERFKIFNERGRQYTSKKISYREGYQEARILFANTIKSDGKVVSLDQKDIFDSSQHAGFEFYTDIKIKRFTMPAVENGCIVEYAYEVKNLKPVFNHDFYTLFLSQNIYPIEEDIMEIVLPASVELKIKKFNMDMIPRIVSEGGKRRYIFTNLKQKGIIPESRMPSLADRNTFPQFSAWTMNSWEPISRWYTKLVQEQMKPSLDLVNFTGRLIAGKKTNEEKISAIFNFVAQDIRYVAVLLGPHTHKPHAAYDIFQKRYGDCKDKTVLLLTMLKIAGIDGLPALVPANREYFDDGIPSLSAFNHVIAVVLSGNQYFWLDATNEVASYRSTPFIQPTSVFLINSDGSYRFLKTPPPDPHKDFVKQEGKFIIDNDGHADLDIKYEYVGKAAESVRYFYKYLPPDQRKKSYERHGIEVKELQMSSFADLSQPFVVHLKGHLKNLAQKIDENTMFLSNIVRLDTYRDITAAKDRKYPIVIHPTFYFKETTTYAFPAGFKIKNMPKPYISDMPFNYRKENYDFIGSTLSIYLETHNRDKTIIRDEIDNFYKYAIELQKHESSVKNMMLERR